MIYKNNPKAEKQAQEFLKERLEASGQLDKAQRSYKIFGSESAKRKSVAEIKYTVESELRSDLKDDVVDPYSNVPSKKLPKDKVMSLTQSTYGNKLLEKILKVSDRTDVDSANLKFQETMLSHMTNINKSLELIVANTTKKEEAKREEAQREDIAFKPSNLAKEIAKMSVGGIFKELKQGFMNKADTSGMGGILMTMLGTLAGEIREGTLGARIKGMMQDAAINRLPEKYKKFVTGWMEDPVKLIQLQIDKLAADRNSLISDIASQFKSSVKPDMTVTRKKIDPNAKAEFDNKFYFSVTKIIPEQLMKIVAALEGSSIKKWDWEKSDYVDAVAAYAKDLRDKEGALTVGVNDIINDMTLGFDSSMANDPVIRAMFKFDKKGEVIKDANGKAQLTNPQYYRILVANMIKSEMPPEHLLQFSARQLIAKYHLDKGMDKHIAVGVLSNYLLFIKYQDPTARAELMEKLYSSKNNVHKKEDNGEHDVLSPEIKASVQAAMAQEYGDRDTWRDNVNSINAKIIQSNWASIGGNGRGGYGGSRSGSFQRYNPKTEFANTKALTQDASEKEIKKWNKFKDAKFSLGAGESINDKLYGGFRDMGISTSVGEPTDLDKYKQELEARLRYKDINLDQYEEMMNRGPSKKEEEKHKKSMARIKKALEMYEIFDQANLTAQARSLIMGNSVAYWKSRGYISSADDILKVMKEDGSIDTKKISEYNMQMFDDQEFLTNARAKAKKNKASVFDGGIVDSIPKSLSKIFGDPRIADKAGYTLGGATGLAIGKILKDQGIVQSNALGYILGAAGMGIMSLESTKKYMRNILGPEGDIRAVGPDGKKGATNKEIFMAKFMNTYLPAMGFGGKASMAVLKAFKGHGALGWAVGLPAATITGIVAGFAGSAMMKFLRNSLFKKRDKDDKSWMGKIGGFLKEIPGVKKFFALADDRDDLQVNIDVLKRFRTEQDTLRQTYEAEKKPATADKHKGIVKRLTKAIDALEKLKNLEDGPVKDKKMKAIIEAVMKDVSGVIDKDEMQKAFDDEMDARDASQESGDLANKEYNNFEKSATSKHKDILNSFTSELREEEGNLTPGGKVKSGKSGKSKFEDASYRERAIRGEFGKDAQAKARVFETLSGEEGLGKQLEELINDYMTANSESIKVAGEVFRTSGDNINDVLGVDGAKELLSMMTDYQSGKITHKEAMKRYEAFMERPEVKAKHRDLNDIISARLTADDMMDQMIQFARLYIQRTTGLSGIDLDERTMGTVKTALTSAPDSKRLSATAKKFLTKMANFGTTYIKGEENMDVTEYDEYEKIASFISGMEGSKANASDMRFRDDDLSDSDDGSGAGYSGGKKNKRRPKGERPAKMKDFSDLKFADGRSLGVIGCAVMSFYNALKFIGINPPDVDTLRDIAEPFVTDGGVDHGFFLSLNKKLGYTLKAYDGKSDNVLKLLEKNLTKWCRRKASTVIFLLKNIGGEGNHFVTCEGQTGFNVRINDPEGSGIETVAIGEIASRIVSFYVLEKEQEYKENEIKVDDKEKEPKRKNRIVAKIEDIKERFKSKYRNIKSKVDFFTKDVPEFFTGQAFADEKTADNTTIWSKMLEKLDIIAGNTDNISETTDVRIVDDETLPLKMEDLDAARALAKNNSQKKGASKNAQVVKKTLENKAIVNEMEESDAMEDNIAKIAENTTGGQVVSGQSGKTEEKKEEKEGLISKFLGSDFFGSLLGSVLGGGGVKGLLGKLGKFGPLLKTVGKFAGPIAAAFAAAPIINWGAKNVTSGYKRAWGGLKGLNPFTNETKEAVIDPDTGEIIRSAENYDVTASLRHIRDGRNFATASAKLTSMALSPLATARSALKTVVSNSSSSGLASRMAKSGLKIADKLDDAARAKGMLKIIPLILDGIQGFFAKLGSNKVVAKLIGGSDFMKGVVPKMLQNLKKVLPGILKSAATSKGVSKGLAVAAKGIPFLGQAVLLGQAIWSFQDGFRKAHIHLNTGDPSSVSFGDRLKVAFTKLLYDIGPDLLASFLPPGFSWAALGLIAVARLKFTWAWCLDKVFDEEERKKMRIRDKESGKTLKQLEDEANKEIDDNEKQLRSVRQDKQALENKVKLQNLKDDDNIDSPSGVITVAEYKKQLEEKEKSLQDKINSSNEQKKKINATYTTTINTANTVAQMNSGSYTPSAGPTAKGPEPQATESLVTDEMRAKWKTGKDRWSHPSGNPNQVITSPFGPRPHLRRGSKWHKGIDLRAAYGSPIYAAKDGKVTASKTPWGLISIDHGDGTQTRYLHLSKRVATAGQTVKAGDLLGYAGGTDGGGNTHSYDPHLHFEVIKNGKHVDPLLELGLPLSSIKRGPGQVDNNAYIEKYKSLEIEQANKEVAKENSKGVDAEKGGPPDWTYGPTTDLPPTEKRYESDKQKQIVNIMNNGNKNLEQAINTLNVKFDKMINLMSQVVQLMSENNNNSVLEAISGSKI